MCFRRGVAASSPNSFTLPGGLALRARCRPGRCRTDVAVAIGFRREPRVRLSWRVKPMRDVADGDPGVPEGGAAEGLERHSPGSCPRRLSPRL